MWMLFEGIGLGVCPLTNCGLPASDTGHLHCRPFAGEWMLAHDKVPFLFMQYWPDVLIETSNALVEPLLIRLLNARKPP